MTSTAFSLRRIALSAFGPSLLFGLGEGAILPVIPLTARALGASVPMTALLVALIGVGSLVSNIPASLITMHRGERWAIVAGAIWCALAMALCGWSGHLGLFAIGSFMVGMSQAVFTLARQSYLTDAVPIEFRARAMSTLGGTMRIGMFIGPFIAAAAIHRYGLVGAYGVGILALLVSGAVAMRMPDLQVDALGANPAPVSSRPGAPTILSTLRDNRHVFITLGIGILLVSAVRTTRQIVIPLWADHLALEPSVTSIIYGLAGGVDMLLFYPAGKVMDQMGRRWVAVPSMLIMGAGLLMLPFTGGAVSLLLAAMAIGFGNGIGSGMMMTLGADHSPRQGRAHFLGVWRLMADVGALVRPGAVIAAGRYPDAGRRHRGYRADRIPRSRTVGLLDSAGTDTQGGCRALIVPVSRDAGRHRSKITMLQPDNRRMPHAVSLLRAARLARSAKPFLARGGFKRERCAGCRLVPSHCMCALRPSVPTRAGVCLLMADIEPLKPSNTGWLVADVVADTFAFGWTRTDTDPALLTLLRDPQWQAYVVFPGEYAESERVVYTVQAPQPSGTAMGQRPLFILLDGTWAEARKMFCRSPYLASLPVLSLRPDRISGYKLRRSRRDDHFCTSEVAALCLALAGEQVAEQTLTAYLDVFTHHYLQARNQLPIAWESAAHQRLRELSLLPPPRAPAEGVTSAR